MRQRRFCSASVKRWRPSRRVNTPELTLSATSSADACVVLVVTHGGDDEHADRVIAALTERGATPLRFDTELYPGRAQLSFTAGGAGTGVELHIDGHSVRDREIGAVLYRHRRLPRAGHLGVPDARRMAEAEWLALIDGALLSLDAFWVNHPAANRLARHKPLQLTLAQELGLRVAPTCITADPATVRALWERWGGRMVAKLAGGQVVDADGETPFAVFTTQLVD